MAEAEAAPDGTGRTAMTNDSRGRYDVHIAMKANVVDVSMTTTRTP
jgi:hypothetical protein